jgi:uncharacterized protein (UPF0548 family)
MRVMTAGRARAAAFDLERWVKAPLNIDPAHGRVGRHDVHSIELVASRFDQAVEALLRYRIFSPQRMRAHVSTADGMVAPDAIIVQRVLLGPLALEMAVRVLDVSRDNGRGAAFTYATVRGHVERGLATFSVRAEGGGLVFTIETWSSAGTALAKLAGPFARHAQRASTREALAYFRDALGA